MVRLRNPSRIRPREVLMNLQSRSRYPKIILIAFLLFAAAWAFNPVDRKDWALENALTAIFVLFLILTYKRMPFSNISYTLIFLFMCLHTIGAHYTCSKVSLQRLDRRHLRQIAQRHARRA